MGLFSRFGRRKEAAGSEESAVASGSLEPGDAADEAGVTAGAEGAAKEPAADGRAESQDAGKTAAGEKDREAEETGKGDESAGSPGIPRQQSAEAAADSGTGDGARK
ncbi:hypothetical protein [Streptomyces chattanoogensis]|uniref:hypothetical protein n=1 Tax=Streptomyces chattanoogensis TaxID=66876 RepID=UPI0036AA0B39